MKIPQTRVVFDRKNTATNTKPALIQIEVLYEGKKKYISTGVKVCKNQYNVRHGVCGRFDMLELNKRIAAVKALVDEKVSALLSEGEFSMPRLSALLAQEGGRKTTFLAFMEEHMETRTDVRPRTRKGHESTLNALRDFGGIVTFDDLTRDNIMSFDKYLHSRGLKQSTIRVRHSILKSYIHEAIRRGFVQTSPYLAVTIKAGSAPDGRWLSESEFERLRLAEFKEEALCRVRDMFVFQCYTGLAFTDLMRLDSSVIEKDNGVFFINGTRVKTGARFCSVLLPEAKEIMDKYGGRFAKISLSGYDGLLKKVAALAGIDKPVASHYGRRTCGMLLLNKGVSMEVVAKVLGHTSISTTEKVYAKILNRSVVREVSEKFK